MKKLIIFLFAATLSVVGYAQSQKVVVDSSGEVVGTYVKTNANTYTVKAEGGDFYQVSKANHKVITYSAENGQGYIEPKNWGKTNVRNAPSTEGAVIGKIIYERGDLPETYNCLGKENGWYKIDFEGKVGYIRADLAKWWAN